MELQDFILYFFAIVWILGLTWASIIVFKGRKKEK